MCMAKVTVITATTGNRIFPRVIESVANQTHREIQHLIIADGIDRGAVVENMLRVCGVGKDLSHVNVVSLPYSIGKDRWNGHRIYAAGTYMAEGDFVMYLDDDNTLAPTHIEDCLKVVESGKDWTFSFRNIVDEEGTFICQDNCESLGKWSSILDPRDYFVDVNCYFLPVRLAVSITPVWYRKFREPGQMEVDRALAAVLRQVAPNFDSTYNYTVNYKVGNTANSVQSEFFLKGNQIMLQKYNNNLPWRK